ncbi:glycine zipper domain-containing protein [bacterium]|nr:glycine zipper domain-containing protein [bacterium]MDA7518713.1 glycine zipper domain-containing protein [Akkermansiaceae bacterium]MDA7537619.1 glycine zipper domain-containing protein [Akkermansiaceae bacterium]MDA7538432.1 glycine zipper domain-containing protein [Akkermansiaceae bacterium]MDA7650975.1 glycine zipper domain-containing protein [Akkermansiaceae bacterium]
MKSKLTIIAGIVSTLAFSSCTQQSNVYDPNAQAKRTAANAAIGGAVLGGIIGHQSGKGLEGAAVGAAVGGGGGYLYGQNKQAQ